MKRFQFPLERVRRWRLEQAGVEELKLQQLRAELAAMQAARQQIETEAAETVRLILAQPMVEPLELETMDSFRIYIKNKVQRFLDRERQWGVKVAEQCQRVIEARRQFELLDKIRQRAFGEWRAAVEKEQETLAAELFLAKARRDYR